MKLWYRVEVDLIDKDGDERNRVFYTKGNDSNKILKNITTVLDQCLVEYKRVEISPLDN